MTQLCHVKLQQEGYAQHLSKLQQGRQTRAHQQPTSASVQGQTVVAQQQQQDCGVQQGLQAASHGNLAMTDKLA